LQLAGYQAQIFEWINDEETSKNLMLTASKRRRPLSAKKVIELRRQLGEMIDMFGVKSQHLLTLLKKDTSQKLNETAEDINKDIEGDLDVNRRKL
jgi:hypothetical protein